MNSKKVILPEKRHSVYRGLPLFRQDDILFIPFIFCDTKVDTDNFKKPDSIKQIYYNLL